MSPEQFEELKSLIKATIHTEVSSIVEEKFKTIIRKLDDVDEDINSGFVEVAEDRKDFAIMKTSQATMERLSRELLDIVDNQTRRLAKTVEHKADQAIETSAQAVADSVEPAVEKMAKKLIKGLPFGNNKKWWQFWRNKDKEEVKLDKEVKKDNNNKDPKKDIKKK